MKVLQIFSAIVAAVIMLATGSAVSAAPRVNNFVEGVDWKNQVITVTGEGVAPADAVNYTQAKGLASKAAQADAYRKLAEIINGVRVEGETTVEKMLTTQDRVQLRVEATIKGAKIIDETFLSDGGYRVVMQVPLFGVSNSLAGAVLERPTAVEPFPNPVVEVAPSSLPYTSATPIKKRLEVTKVTVEEESYIPAPTTPTTPYRPPLSRMSIPSLDTIILQKMQSSISMPEPTYQTAYNTPTTSQPVRKSVTEYASMAEGNYTGLIVDCRGLELQPVMSPVIMNSNGTKIYGHKNLDIDRVISEGMADYIDDTEHVDRAGTNPLVVKAVGVQNFNSNPVLAVPDSNRVLIENYATKFLKDLKVVFIFD
ncbi:MAG: LPP20 family lipoprotein [Selenomonadaceae bacterium]|nr:LPP20 family lipoprotein [Selenomonadaceae bacterium]